MPPTPPSTTAATSDPGHAAVDLTAALVAVDSVNPGLVPGAAGEQQVAVLLADRLDAAGFDVRLVRAPSDPRRVGVLAVREGRRPGRTVVLDGHLDTVGVEGMDDPFTPRTDGSRMYGRGTCDMKAGVAGLVVAAERLAAADAPGTLVLALVADEEDGSVGTPPVLEALQATGITPDVCLVGEPTWLDLAVAHRGYAVVRVDLNGRAAHSSRPAEGVDALAHLGRLLVAVADADRRLRESPAHPLLGHGSLMSTVAGGGSAPFTVAASAHALVERRTLPGETPADAGAEVRALLDALASGPDGVHGVTADVTLTLARDAWQADDHGPAAELSGLLADTLPAAGAVAPQRVGAPYWMESALWQATGVPTVVCGPAGGGLHAVDEWVDLDQVRAYPVAVAEAVGAFLTGRPLRAVP